MDDIKCQYECEYESGYVNRVDASEDGIAFQPDSVPFDLCVC